MKPCCLFGIAGVALLAGCVALLAAETPREILGGAGLAFAAAGRGGGALQVWIMSANGSGLRWSTVRNIAAGWVFTLPAAALLSGLLYWFFRAIS